jgi:hypothetical protein
MSLVMEEVIGVEVEGVTDSRLLLLLSRGVPGSD